MRRIALVLSTLGGLLVPPALSQPVTAPPVGTPLGTPPPGSVGSTVTGGLLDKAGATTAVGQTKPAGSPVGDGLGTRADLQEKSRQIDRKIDTGICTGCK